MRRAAAANTAYRTTSRTTSETSTRAVDGQNLVIVRPFVNAWRREIDHYIKKEKLRFREDASNRDDVALRNRMRRRIIPYLEKTAGRNIRENIWRTAMITAEEETFFETLLPEKILHLTELAVEPLREMSVAVQRRMLHVMAGSMPRERFGQP